MGLDAAKASRWNSSKTLNAGVLPRQYLQFTLTIVDYA